MKSQKKSILLLVAVLFISVFSLYNSTKVFADDLDPIVGRKLPVSYPCDPWQGGTGQTCEPGGNVCIPMGC